MKIFLDNKEVTLEELRELHIELGRDNVGSVLDNQIVVQYVDIVNGAIFLERLGEC